MPNPINPSSLPAHLVRDAIPPIGVFPSPQLCSLSSISPVADVLHLSGVSNVPKGYSIVSILSSRGPSNPKTIILPPHWLCFP